MMVNILIISVWCLLMINHVLSVKEWMRKQPFSQLLGLKKEGLFSAPNGNTFDPHYMYNCVNDPVEILCMLPGKTEFITDKFDRSENSEYSFDEKFLRTLRRSTKPLFVFIHGMGIDGAEMDSDHNNQTKSNRANAISFARETEKNVCYITFAYKDVDKTFLGFLNDVKRIAKSSRFEFVARIAWELIVQVYERRPGRTEAIIKEVEMAGFSWGAHMVALACRTFQEVGRREWVPELRIKRIFGLDPANVEANIGKRVIQRDDAVFSELIHSEPGRSGLLHPHGNVDIYVIDIPPQFLGRAHYVAPYLFHLVATKRCKLFAHKGYNNKGRVEVWDETLRQKDNEYEIGIYNKHYAQRYGVYSISFLHPCIQKYEVDELRHVNIKKPMIWNIKARKELKNLNEAKPESRTQKREKDAQEAETKKAAAVTADGDDSDSDSDSDSDTDSVTSGAESDKS